MKCSHVPSRIPSDAVGALVITFKAFAVGSVVPVEIEIPKPEIKQNEQLFPKIRCGVRSQNMLEEVVCFSN